jgi:hypothetical protein
MNDIRQPNLALTPILGIDPIDTLARFMYAFLLRAGMSVSTGNLALGKFSTIYPPVNQI